MRTFKTTTAGEETTHPLRSACSHCFERLVAAIQRIWLLVTSQGMGLWIADRSRIACKSRSETHLLSLIGCSACVQSVVNIAQNNSNCNSLFRDTLPFLRHV